MLTINDVATGTKTFFFLISSYSRTNLTEFLMYH
jgi:hypothetical protein